MTTSDNLAIGGRASPTTEGAVAPSDATKITCPTSTPATTKSAVPAIRSTGGAAPAATAVSSIPAVVADKHIGEAS
jgi:hypothetical protein